MLQSISKLPIVKSSLVEVQKAFVDCVLQHGLAEVDAVLELFNGWTAHPYAAGRTQLSEEVKDLCWIAAFAEAFLSLAEGKHICFADVADSSA
jgi:hypothetical protein